MVPPPSCPPTVRYLSGICPLSGSSTVRTHWQVSTRAFVFPFSPIYRAIPSLGQAVCFLLFSAFLTFYDQTILPKLPNALPSRTETPSLRLITLRIRRLNWLSCASISTVLGLSPRPWSCPTSAWDHPRQRQPRAFRPQCASARIRFTAVCNTPSVTQFMGTAGLLRERAPALLATSVRGEAGPDCSLF